MANSSGPPSWSDMLQPWMHAATWGLGQVGQLAADGAQVSQRLGALLQHAHGHSAFYRRHHHVNGGHVPPWAELSPVRKSELMAHFDEWVTDPALTLGGVHEFLADPAQVGRDYLGRYAIWQSSGTSGEPGIFVHDPAALQVYGALLHTRMDRRIAGARWWQQAAGGSLGWWGLQPRHALIAALDGHYAGISFWRRQSQHTQRLGVQARSYSVTWPIERLCRELQAWQPQFVASYPSMLAELARQQLAGRLNLEPLALWSGGEGLNASTRRWIESVFGAPVVNDYGASECLSIGFECRHGRLHLNDDWVIFEPVDADLRPVPAGVASHSVLLTNLANHAQPLIRYVLGDSVMMFPDPCPCGNRRPSFVVEGRCDDTLRLSNGRDELVHISPMALTTAIEEAADLHRFQVRQTAGDAVDLRLDPTGDPMPATRQQAALQALRDYLAAQGLPDVHVRLDPEPLGIDARSGKLRQVVCLI